MTYNTERRTRILEFMKENADKSFTIEEICSGILHGEGGKSTVYRIVSELVADGKLKRLSDGKTRHCTYQYVGDDECVSHLHLKCRDCGKLIHLCDEISREFANALLSEDGFTLDAGAMLFGKCADCGSQTKAEHKCTHGHCHHDPKKKEEI